jgi:hypothetical protein
MTALKPDTLKSQAILYQKNNRPIILTKIQTPTAFKSRALVNINKAII